MLLGELQGSEPSSIQPLAMDEEKDVPIMVSPNLVVESVNDFYHVVGLLCDGFEGKMLVLIAEIRIVQGMR